MKSDQIGNSYTKINQLVNTGDIPSDTDTCFRIFTGSSGSIKIEDLVIYKVISNLPREE